jgi:hypothetical protein
MISTYLGLNQIPSLHLSKNFQKSQFYLMEYFLILILVACFNNKS